MRQVTLANIIDVANGNDKATTKAAKMRAKNLVNAAKSLDLLRQNLQNSINKDIDNVIKKYLTVSIYLWYIDSHNNIYDINFFSHILVWLLTMLKIIWVQIV